MSDFAREMVRCLNRYFKARQVPGFAYLPAQRTAIGDVWADSPDPACSLLIVCRSIADRKLYFSQHFHAGRDNARPVEAVTEFLAAGGRTGYLAVEFRKGTGRETFLIPWGAVLGHYRSGNGVTIEDARTGIALTRVKDGYVLEHL
jgi:hypothetical protein